MSGLPQKTIECDSLAVRQIYTRLANGVYPPNTYVLTAGIDGKTVWSDPAILNQGATGSTGPTGYHGVQGYQGPINEGYTGPTGIKGPQGVRGYIGDFGPQGSIGPQGVQGTQGIQGPQGLIGFQGTQGIQGVQGNQGNQGTIGPQGNQGPTPIAPINTYYWKYTSPYTVHPTPGYFTYDSTSNTFAFDVIDLNGTNRSIFFNSLDHMIDASGFNAIMQLVSTTDPANQVVVYIPGSEGRIGNVARTITYASIVSGTAAFTVDNTYAISVMFGGTAGPQGIAGPQGFQGTQGTQGPIGIQGPQGVQGWQGAGPQGPLGPWGVQGYQGFQGTTGPTGPHGYQGVEGPPNPNAPVNYTVRLFWDGTAATPNYDITRCSVPTGLTTTPMTFNGSTTNPQFLLSNITPAPVIPNCITVFAATVVAGTTYWHNVSYNIGAGGAEIVIDPIAKTIKLNNFTRSKLSANLNTLSWPTTLEDFVVYVNLTYFL